MTTPGSEGEAHVHAAVFVGSFPRYSETFITGQLSRLLAHGQGVEIYSLQGPPAPEEAALATRGPLAADHIYRDSWTHAHSGYAVPAYVRSE